MKKFPFFLCFNLMCLLSMVTIAQRNEIPNGSFENWPDGFAPEGYGAFQAPQKQYVQLRTVFKSEDAKLGRYSVRLRNTSIKEYVAAMNINTYGVNFPDQVIPAGIWSCSGNCQIPPRSNTERVKFPVTKRYKTLCGFYKGTLAGGDKLLVSIIMFSGNNIMGGSESGAMQHALVTQSANGWKKFEIPITYIDMNDRVIPDGAALQFSIVGAGYPQNAFAGGTGQSVHLGTEVFIDDVAFCEGKADLLVFNPKVLNEQSPPATGGGDDDPDAASSGQNSSTGLYTVVPKTEQMDPGAQTFVNLDNDDMDEFFDHNPRDLPKSDFDVAGGDDEFIKIVLKIKKDITGGATAMENATATLSAIKGQDDINVWEAETKGNRLSLPKTFNVLSDFNVGAGDYEGFLVKEIWVEGIAAHTTQQGTILSFKYSKDPAFEEKFAITVIGIEKIEWIGKENSINNDNSLDRDPNHRNPSDRRPLVGGGDCDGDPGSFSLKPEGIRVFPDRRVRAGIVLDEKPKNKVDVKVTLSVKPVKPVKLYFKSFDVDDPTANGTSQPTAVDVRNEFWVDDESKNSDNRGEAGTGNNKKAGKITGEDNDGILETEFNDVTKTFEFEVTMQPGDNFRIVGSCDKDFIKNLRNDDKHLNTGNSPDEKNLNKQRIADKWVWKANKVYVEKAEIPLPQKYASKTLSVWRFLNVEVDYMTELTDDEFTGRIRSVLQNEPEAGQTTLMVSENFSTELQSRGITRVSTFNNNNGIRDHFQEGKIIISLPGVISDSINTPYTVLHNSGNNSDGGPDKIIVQGVVPAAAARRTYSLRNDDQEQGFKKGDNLKTCIRGRVHVTDPLGKCLVADRYAYAYIVPDFNSLNSSTLNQETTSPFTRNLESYDLDDNVLRRNYKFDNAAFKDYEDFWTVYMLFALKGATYEDGDPDGENNEERKIPDTPNEGMISGIADKQGLGIHVFLDGVVERNGRYMASNSIGLGEMDCIAHELAHLFGAQHPDGGQMGVPGYEDKYPENRWFTQKTLARMRDCKQPQGN